MEFACGVAVAVAVFKCLKLLQDAFKSVMMAIKTSNDLPCSGDDYDYYSSFNSFRDVMDVEGQRILHM